MTPTLEPACHLQLAEEILQPPMAIMDSEYLLVNDACRVLLYNDVPMAQNDYGLLLALRKCIGCFHGI